MAKINIRELFKKKMLNLSPKEALLFPDLKEDDFAKFYSPNSLLDGQYQRDDLNKAWVGFLAMLEGFANLDVAISVDMSGINQDGEDNDEGHRVFAKIEEWNDLDSIQRGEEISLIAIYQSHNFEISTFKDPYVGKNKKNRPK